MLKQKHELVNSPSKHPLINNYVLTLCNMMAGGELIHRVIKALHYFFETILFKREHELVVGASKLLLIKIKDLMLSSMLACGVPLCRVMKAHHHNF